MDARTLLALRRTPRRLWILAALAWALGLAFLQGSDLLPVTRLALFGVEAEGRTIAERETDRGPRTHPVRSFTVEFETGDGERAHVVFETVRPSRETLARLYPETGGVRVVHLPSDPSVARVAGELDVVWSLVLLAIASAVLGALPVLTDWALRVGHRLPPEVDRTVDRLADRVDRLVDPRRRAADRQ